MKLKRIYMNEVDSSPGGGAVVPAPAQAPAQGAPAVAPSIPVDQAKAMFGEMLGEFRNGIFADLRKAGAFGKEKPVESQGAAPVTQAPATASATASTGLSASDVEGMLERERVITRAATQHSLNDAQLKRMKLALTADKPEDVSAWTTSYLTDMGLVKATPAPSTAAHAASAPEAPKPAPIAPSAPSGHGSPTQNGVVDLFSLSASDLKALGPSGVRANLEKLVEIGNQMAGIPQRPKPPSQR